MKQAMPEDKYKEIPLDEHVLHMWTPLAFDTPPGYDYLRTDWPSFLLHFLIKFIAALLLIPYNVLWYGLKIRGRKNLKGLRGSGAVTISNHVHPMDCTFVNLALLSRRIYYLTLASNFKSPLIRRLIKILGAGPIPGSLSSKKEMLDAMKTALEKGHFVHIYPEGILRPYYPDLRQCKSGAFHLAYSSGKPIVPLAITYRKPQGIYCMKRKPCLSLTVLEPVYPNTKAPKGAEVRRMQELCEKQIQDCIQKNRF